MATVDLGKIKFNWTGAYADTTSYEADDVVQYGGDVFIYIGTVTPAAYDAAETYDDTTKNVAIGSDNKIYRYINATPSDGNDPTASPLYWEVNQPGTTSPATTYWDLMVEGTSTLTTQGDLVTHDGTNTVRLARGNTGEVLTVSGNDLTYQAIDAMKGRNVLQPNYDQVINPGAAQTYGASGSRAWLADYTNNWIPESGIVNPAMSPMMFNDTGQHYGGYRGICWLNENHEIVVRGTDSYYWGGNSGGNMQDSNIVMPISSEFGGLLEGEYFVRLWMEYRSIWALTNKGSLFFAGYNGYGQAGVGDTTNRYQMVRIPAFGPNETHDGTSCRVSGFHVASGGNGYPNYHRCYAIDEEGRLFAWGYNSNGALGIGNSTNQSRPVEVTAVPNCVQITSGYLSAFAVDADGDLYRCGYNSNGHLAGLTISANTTTFTQSTSATNVYQVVHNAQSYYTSSWTYTGTSYYIDTDGDLYAAGYAGNGQLGDGTTTQKNAWTAIGGATTFSGIYINGNSRDLQVHAIGGTPGNPDDNHYVWGYNSTGALGLGNTTNQTSPTQPSTTTVYTNTTSSTATDSAPTSTALAYPRTEIKKIWPTRGGQGQSTANFFVEDDDGKIWKFGYNSSLDYYRDNSGNTNINNTRLDISPWSTPETTTNGYFWAGEVQRRVVAFTGHGYDYNSEGTFYCYLNDGTLWAQGYNNQGQIRSDANYIGHWIQIN